MKTLYSSPVITVEELTKVDVLCDSTQTSNVNNKDAFNVNPQDNINQLSRTLTDMSNFM